MKFLCFFVALIIFSSACQYIETPPNGKAMEKLVLSNTTQWLKAEKNLYACGFGGQGKKEIEMLALSFFYYEPIDMEHGRDLLISAVHRFLKEIDEETRIHKYLYKYPFPSERIQIRIFRQTLDGSPVPLSPSQLTVVSFVDGVCEYRTDDPNSEAFILVHTETYEEALVKWNATQQQRMEDSNSASKAM